MCEVDPSDARAHTVCVLSGILNALRLPCNTSFIKHSIGAERPSRRGQSELDQSEYGEQMIEKLSMHCDKVQRAAVYLCFAQIAKVLLQLPPHDLFP